MSTAAHTARADQLAAAVAEATRHQHRIADREHLPLLAIPDNPWLADQVRRLHTAITSRQARVCPHITGSPSVVYAAAWTPGLLVCPACVGHLRPTDDAEDGTCDRCRRPANELYAGIVQTGPLLLAYGLCRHCVRRTGLANLHPGGTP
ncbi:hypothetical protein ITP53_17305 [Nonomuraea sp. K274]|uniref:Uncharacterized protein n=1 Tax=Nonomuraea cypriaca TaxID=1187855 RepID=A0A931EYM1_9ACTN|nr:hypothetical protein [Nonomuraea cypriaca]MBF8187460.1 hypothetical protein [Nonomuraea cypriaca]